MQGIDLFGLELEFSSLCGAKLMLILDQVEYVRIG